MFSLFAGNPYNYFIDKTKHRVLDLLPKQQRAIFDTILLCFKFGESKYRIYKLHVLNNGFLSAETKKIATEVFVQAQRTYFGFCSLARLYRRRRAIASPTNKDLYLNDLSLYGKELTIDLLVNKTLYKFSLRDLLRCWKAALNNSCELIEDPTCVKNPYTNINFADVSLYNIYFAALFHGMSIPIEVGLFFKCRFQMDKLLIEYGYIFKDNAIAAYVSGESGALFEDLLEIKQSYPNYTFNLAIDAGSSPAIRDKIVNEMRHIIMHYYYSHNAASNYKRSAEHHKFTMSLMEFNSTHKNFGRKIFKREGGRFKAYYTF